MVKMIMITLACVSKNDRSIRYYQLSILHYLFVCTLVVSGGGIRFRSGNLSHGELFLLVCSLDKCLMLVDASVRYLFNTFALPLLEGGVDRPLFRAAFLFYGGMRVSDERSLVPPPIVCLSLPSCFENRNVATHRYYYFILTLRYEPMYIKTWSRRIASKPMIYRPLFTGSVVSIVFFFIPLENFFFLKIGSSLTKLNSFTSSPTVHCRNIKLKNKWK